MATVIDALIVELGLDPKNFSKGQKKAAQDVVDLDKQVDKSGKNIQNTVNGVRNQVLAMMAAFLGGRGIKEFIQDMVKAEAEAARLAKTLDTIPSELSAWGGAATLVGGSTQGLAGSVQGLVSQFQQFSLTGESGVIPWFRALRVNITDLDTGKMRDFGSIMLDLADRFQGMDPARAAAFGRALGFDQGTINLLIQGRKAVQAMLAEQRRLGIMTKEDAEAGLALQHSWLALQQSSTSLGRTLLTDVAPILVKILDGLTNLAVWVRGHKPLLEGFFTSLGVIALGLTIAFFPVTATVAAITLGVVALSAAIGLLYDDWKTWTEGGKSSFGGFWRFVTDKWNSFAEVVGPAIKAAAAMFMDYVTIVKDELKFIYTLFFGTGDEIRAAWGQLWSDLKKGGSDFVANLPAILNAIGFAMTSVIAAALNWIQGRVNAFWHAIFRHDLFKAHDFQAPPIPGQDKKQPAAPGTAPPPAEAKAAAVAAEKKYGVPAAISLAQYKLESDNGKHMPAGSNNPFGIKAKPGEAYVEATTREFIHGQMLQVKQRFRKFDSLGQAFDEHAKLLATAPVYKKARAAGKDVNAYADALTGTYATDPEYGAKLKTIMVQQQAAPAAAAGAKNMAAAPALKKNVAAAPSARVAAAAAGAKNMAAAQAVRSGNTTTTTTSHQTKIEKVIVQTQAKDAVGIAHDIGPAIERDAFATQAQYSAA